MARPIVVEQLAFKRSFNPGTVPESLREGEPFIQFADEYLQIGDGVTPPADLPRVPFKSEADLLEPGGPIAVALATKADQIAVENALATKADRIAVENALATKADRIAVENALAFKADWAAVEAALATKATPAQIATAVQGLATTASLNAGLANAAAATAAALAAANRAFLAQPEVSLASAATTDVGAATSNRVFITGTATINSLGTVANLVRVLRFAGGATLVHGAGLVLPANAANIVTRADDTAMAFSDDVGIWRLYFYQRAEGFPVTAIQRRGRALTGAVSPDPLDVSLVLPTKDYRLQPGFTPEAGTFSRAAAATYRDPMAALRSVASGAPRFTSDLSTGENSGILIEDARTNAIRNSTFQGGVAGTPGTPPTNMSITVGATGLTSQIVGFGTDTGIDYMDVRFFGTVAALGDLNIALETGAGIPANTGQPWSLSIFRRLVGGTVTGINSINLAMDENTSGGGYVAYGGGVSLSLSSLGPGFLRVMHNRTLAGGATVGAIRPYVRAQVAAGAVVDFTIRLGLPQAEQGDGATSPIRSTSAATTRAADLLTVPADATWFNPVEGTVYMEAVAPPADATNNRHLLQFDDGTLNHRILLRRNNSGTTLVALFVVGGSVAATITLGPIVPGQAFRVALTYTATSLIGSLNGAPVAQGNYNAPGLNITTCRIGAQNTATGSWHSGISRFAYIPRAISAAAVLRMTA